jgi:hypothetical protein
MRTILDNVRAAGKARADLAREILSAAQELYDEGVIPPQCFKHVTESLELGLTFDAKDRLERAVAVHHFVEDEAAVAVPRTDPPVHVLRSVMDGY